MTSDNTARDEWVDLMLEIAARDRDEYRKLREQAWSLVVISHRRKTDEELTAWKKSAS